MFVLIISSVGLAAFSPQLWMTLATTGFYCGAADLIPLVMTGMIVLGRKYHFSSVLHAKQAQYMMYSSSTAVIMHFELHSVLTHFWGLWGGALFFVAWAKIALITVFFRLPFVTSQRARSSGR